MKKALFLLFLMLLSLFLFCSCTQVSSPKRCEHNYQKDVVQATCKEGGYTRNFCVYCKEEFKADYTSKLSVHSYVDRTVAATCTKKGYTEHRCSVCGISEKINETEYADHKGKNKCTTCGIDYFDALVDLICDEGVEVDGVPTITWTNENIITKWEYDDEKVVIAITDTRYPKMYMCLIIDNAEGPYVYLNQDMIGGYILGVLEDPSTITNNSVYLTYVETNINNSELILADSKAAMSCLKLAITSTDVLFLTLDHGISMYNFGFTNYETI